MDFDLTKPNPHIKEPLFEGLSWTADDFNILQQYLSSELISYIEDKNGPLEDAAMERLCEMSDECSKIYSQSKCAEYRHALYETRHAIRTLKRERAMNSVTIDQQIKNYGKKLADSEAGLKKIMNTIYTKNSSPAAFSSFNKLKDDVDKYKRIMWILTEATDEELKSIMPRE